MSKHVTPRLDHERLIKLLHLVGSDNPHEAEAARSRIGAMLRQSDKQWSDLVSLLGGSVSAIRADVLGAVTDLGATDPAVLAKAKCFLLDLLAHHRLTWAGLVVELCSLSPAAWISRSSPSPDPPDRVNPLDLIDSVLGEYLDMPEHMRIAVGLWIVHTHIYRFFPVTPRLAVRSPTPDCGKTTLLNIIAKLVARPQKFDSATAAAINHLIDASHPTLLLDEIDNASLSSPVNGRLRAILNSGHSVNGTSAMQEKGETRTFSTFCPIAMALPDVVSGLPKTLNSRSVTITLQRASRELRRLDLIRPDPLLDRCYEQILLWANELHPLDPDPPMPATIKNRLADNWRALISIADALGWSDRARKGLLTFAHETLQDDCKIALLRDSKRVFDAQPADRLFSSVLLGALHELEAGDWTEFYGVRGEQQPLSGELARMLRSFGIRPAPIWPLNRTAKSKSARGYKHQQFVSAWARYCPETVTPSQANGIKDMLRVDSDTP